MNSAEARRTWAAMGALTVWLLNVADAVFLSDLPPVPLKDGQIAGMPVRLTPAWLGEGPGLVVSASF